ncbi:sperm acrosome membrane-associated protein 6 isoform X3 [Rhinatrema bivittatum]|uniref:sperm acrosome membrane-associated protein 6 isoform X3 n=1 Tax=Rhinatrema bivittatum TaxID=194408 RepID=UPI00112EB8E1|nr:sperm acrosome membrane-associated protein 6 isoform X3 [Rhinatrema bivittatum]
MFYIERRSTSKTKNFTVDIPDGVRKIKSQIGSLMKAVACIPPCGYQKNARIYKCESCSVVDCGYPLDCELQDIFVNENSRSSFQCTVKFPLPKDVTVVWKFANNNGISLCNRYRRENLTKTVTNSKYLFLPSSLAISFCLFHFTLLLYPSVTEAGLYHLMGTGGAVVYPAFSEDPPTPGLLNATWTCIPSLFWGFMILGRSDSGNDLWQGPPGDGSQTVAPDGGSGRGCPRHRPMQKSRPAFPIIPVQVLLSKANEKTHLLLYDWVLGTDMKH